MTYLKLAFTGKDADPFVVIVGDDDVTVGVDGHARRPLQLTRSPAPDTKSHSKLAVIRENLWHKTREEFQDCYYSYYRPYC